MASFTGVIKTLQDLATQTTAEDTDLIPIGTSVLKKISFANLRKALGVDALNSNKLDASDILYVPANADITGASFSKNFLLIGASAKVAQHQLTYFAKPVVDTDWSGMPSALSGQLWIGYRIVFWRSSNHIFVKIQEFHPVPGRVWSNFYNSGTWTGWKSITPT